MNASTEEKLRALSDPQQRARMAEQAAGTKSMRHLAKWQDHVIVETFTPETAAYAGRRVGDIAEELGKEPFDALVDIAIADGLRTTFIARHPCPHGGRLGGAAADLERPAGDDRGVRRRRPPRHDRRLPLLHRLPGGGGPPAPAAAARAGRSTC